MSDIDSGTLDKTALVALITISSQAAEGDITDPEARQRLLDAARTLDDLRREPQSVSLYYSRCGYELDDPDSHYRDPGSYALYCLLGACTPHEIYATVVDAMQTEMVSGDISPTEWKLRLATAARAELARTGEWEVLS